jgi:hypothetical protein
LRIHGHDVPFEEISERLGVQPTHLHRKGERRGPRSPAWRDDAWHFEPALAETEPLERHIQALWQVVRPHVDYIKALKQRFKVDVFCGYRSSCDTAGFEVSHKCLEHCLRLVWGGAPNGWRGLTLLKLLVSSQNVFHPAGNR